MRHARLRANIRLILPVSLVLAVIACRAANQTRQPGGFVVAPRVAELEGDELTPTALPSPTEPPTATPTPTDSPTAAPPDPLQPTDTPSDASASDPSPTPSLQPALIHYFSVFPEDRRLAPGETFTVFWKLEDVETVSLCAHDHAGWQKWCLDSLPAEGKRDFEMLPDVAWLEMRLIANGLPDPGYLSAYAYAKCANEWFMDDPPFACPNSSIAWLDAIAQRFERGWVIYAASVYDVDIFLDNGAYLDLWLPNGFNNVVDLSAETPPEGLYRPDPQLSAIWAGYVPGAEDLRERLGWAAGPAFSVQTIEQCEFAPPAIVTQPCYQPVAGAIYQFTYQPVQVGDGYMRVGQWVQYTPEP